MTEEKKFNHENNVEQNIKRLVTINDGQTGYAEIEIPANATAWLKGYGYSYASGTTYQLKVGSTEFPKRTDQEGNTTQPMIFSVPSKANGGSKIKLEIINGTGASHTYEVVFYIITTRILDIESEGNELIQPIGGTGGVAGSVSIFNSSGTLSADVVARGDGRNALVVDTEMEFHADNVTIANIKCASTDQTLANVRYLKVDTNGVLDTRLLTATDIVTAIIGSSRTATHTAVSVGSSDTTALALNTNRKSALFVNDSDETIYLSIGGTAVMNTGIRLNPNGGSYEMTQENGNLSTAIIKAICTSGSKTLLVTEFE
jgi:hypothetical protein